MIKTSLYLLIGLFVLPGFLFAQQRDLNYYLDQAKTNSPLINQTKNEFKLIELDLKQVRQMLYKPEVSLEGSVLLAPIISHDNGVNRFELVSEGANKYVGYDLAGTDGGQYQAILSVKQALLSGSKFHSYASQSDIAVQINKNKLDLNIHELEQLVRYQYILCLKSQKQSQNSLKLFEALNSQMLMMKKLVENAIYKQTDLLSLQLETQNFRLEYESLKAEYESNLSDLNLLCGISNSDSLAIPDLELELPVQKPMTSAFLTSYQLDSSKIIAMQSINELNYKPQLEAFANTGLNAVYLPAVNRFGFSTGLRFSWLISDGKQRDLLREKSVIHLENIAFEKKNFETKSLLNKQKIVHQIQLLEQRIQRIQEQINQYQTLYKMYEKELAQGNVSVIEFKTILTEKASKEQEILVLKMEKQSLISSYIYWNY